MVKASMRWMQAAAWLTRRREEKGKSCVRKEERTKEKHGGQLGVLGCQRGVAPPVPHFASLDAAAQIVGVCPVAQRIERAMARTGCTNLQIHIVPPCPSNTLLSNHSMPCV